MKTNRCNPELCRDRAKDTSPLEQKSKMAPCQQVIRTHHGAAAFASPEAALDMGHGLLRVADSAQASSPSFLGYFVAWGQRAGSHHFKQMRESTRSRRSFDRRNGKSGEEDLNNSPGHKNTASGVGGSCLPQTPWERCAVQSFV